ncbi:MAG: glycosyltransferase [Planctomycetota bacterium]
MTASTTERTRPATDLRITAVIHSLDGGGAERVMAGLVSRLAERQSVDGSAGQRRNVVTLVTLGDGSGERHEVSPAVRRVNLNAVTDSFPTGIRGWCSRVRQKWKRHRLLGRAIRESNPDVVLSFCDAMNVSTLLATARAPFPVVVCERSDPRAQSLGRVGNALRRRLYRSAAAVVAQTHEQAKILSELVTDGSARLRLEVIPSAVEVPDSYSSSRFIGLPPSQSETTFLCVGRLEREKGFDRAISAFAEICTRFPDRTLRLAIVGEGSQRAALEARATDLDVQERVAMPGWERPIWPRYETADVFMLPSRYEGFPSALLEAMAMGMPCVVLDSCSGTRQIIHHEVNGYLAHDSAEGLVEGMETILREPSRAQRWGAEAIKVREVYSWNKLVDRFEKLLGSVASAGSKGVSVGRTEKRLGGRHEKTARKMDREERHDV